MNSPTVSTPISRKKPPQLVVALDVPASAQIEPLLQVFPDDLRWFKVGLELFCAEGPAALDPLIRAGRNVFLDLKLHDIPRTVARAVRTAATHQVGMLTVHAAGGPAMLRAAAEAAAACPQPPILVAVTVLTSLDQADLTRMGVTRTISEQALELAEMALNCGIDGLVCSPLEVSQFREAMGTDPVLVTPGVRPAGADAGDQKRVATPAGAVRDGSDFLVVGRPIMEADDPATAARQIIKEMMP